MPEVLWRRHGSFCRDTTSPGRWNRVGSISLTYDGDSTKRVQVKTTTRKIRSSWLVEITTSGRVKTPYDPDDIDQFFIIDGDLNFYLIPIEAVAGMGSLMLNAYQQYRLRKLEPMEQAA